MTVEQTAGLACPVMGGIGTGQPERVKTMQANWIGKSVGAYLEFPVKDSTEKIAVFTTRPDTVYGVTYLVLAPEHPLTLQATTSDRVSAVEAFIKEVASESEIERTAEDKPKKGIATGGIAINPFNEEEIPILIANYVLYEYGTGAVMGVPAHDVRDFKFAKENDIGNHFSSCLGFESGIRKSNGAKKFSVLVHEFTYFLAFGAIECIT
jgi:leucyl-tRNA synthetase